MIKPFIRYFPEFTETCCGGKVLKVLKPPTFGPKLEYKSYGPLY